MKQGMFTVLSNRALTGNVFEMTLRGDTSAITRPGQFVNLLLEGFYLRRPISVCDLNRDVLMLVYKTVGRGTEKMSALRPGAEADLLTGLGNGYDLSLSGEEPLLLGGGAGVPPLYWLARELTGNGKKVHVILGFNTADEVFYEDRFLSLGAEVTVTTRDGSRGIKGFVTDAMPRTYTHTFACGPEPMLRAVWNAAGTSGQYSFEERMGCGFGACMGCSCQTKYGAKRICKDGPVLIREEIIW